MALTWRIRCLSWGIASSSLASVLFWYSLAENHLFQRIMAGSLAILIIVTSLIAFHIASLRCSESHTLKSLILSYVWHEREIIMAKFTLARLEQELKTPRDREEKLLRELINLNGNTEYGRQNRLGEINSIQELRKKHPFTSYDHYKKYTYKIADDKDAEGVLVNEKTRRFGVTSGTTGVGKLIPYTPFWMQGNGVGATLTRLTIHLATNWRLSPVQRRCLLYTHPAYKVSKSGLTIAPYLLYTEKNTIPLAEHSSPPPVLAITDEHTSAYLHMLFAAADANLGLLAAMFSPTLYRAFRLLENNWPAIVHDIATGTIDEKLLLAPELRKSIEGYLAADPARAAQLRMEFEKGFDCIAKRIWPHVVTLEAIDIGGLNVKIMNKYGKGLSISATKFGGTEVGITAVNLWMNEENPRFVILPHTAVHEFIPEKLSNLEQPPSFLVDEVEVGKTYELAMTTRCGFYRYRMGDVIQVVGFHENSPVICVKYRIGELLNVATEKTSSSIVTSAVDKAVSSWPGVQLVDWTCAESPLYDPETASLFYILFVELESNGKAISKVTSDQKSKFDENLHMHDYYKKYRDSGMMSMAKVHLVTTGTFAALRDYTVAHSTASLNQYKTPRKLRTRNSLEWMIKRIGDQETEN